MNGFYTQPWMIDGKIVDVWYPSVCGGSKYPPGAYCFYDSVYLVKCDEFGEGQEPSLEAQCLARMIMLNQWETAK